MAELTEFDDWQVIESEIGRLYDDFQVSGLENWLDKLW